MALRKIGILQHQDGTHAAFCLVFMFCKSCVCLVGLGQSHRRSLFTWMVSLIHGTFTG